MAFSASIIGARNSKKKVRFLFGKLRKNHNMKSKNPEIGHVISNHSKVIGIVISTISNKDEILDFFIKDQGLDEELRKDLSVNSYQHSEDSLLLVELL